MPRHPFRSCSRLSCPWPRWLSSCSHKRCHRPPAPASSASAFSSQPCIHQSWCSGQCSSLRQRLETPRQPRAHRREQGSCSTLRDTEALSLVELASVSGSTVLDSLNITCAEFTSLGFVPVLDRPLVERSSKINEL